MTDTLRDLLHESVADVEMPDVIGSTWSAGRRARRRRAAGAGAGVAAVALVVGGVVWASDRGADSHSVRPVQRPSASQSHSPSAHPSPHLGGAKPDAVVSGLGRVWWGPDLAQEAQLPQWPSVVPPSIDLSAEAPDIAGHPLPRAMAAFALYDHGVPDRVVVMARSGALRAVDVSRLDRLTEPSGSQVWPETDSMLSPTGKYLMFPQDGHVAIFRLSTGTWRTVDTGSDTTVDATWENDVEFVLPRHGPESEGTTYDVRSGLPDGANGIGSLIHPTGSQPASPYGRARSGGGEALSYVVPQDALPVRPGSVDTGEVMAVLGFQRPHQHHDVLSFTSTPGADRMKLCCSVVGWLGIRAQSPVVYESRSATPRLIGWRVGTHEFGRISTIAGPPYYVSSWARLWAEQPPP